MSSISSGTGLRRIDADDLRLATACIAGLVGVRGDQSAGGDVGVDGRNTGVAGVWGGYMSMGRERVVWFEVDMRYTDRSGLIGAVGVVDNGVSESDMFISSRERYYQSDGRTC